MALKRTFLAAMGIEDEKIQEIIDAHMATVNGLKEELDQYKEKAESYDKEHKKVTELEKEIDGLKESTKDSYKVKYEAMKEEFAEYKKNVDAEKAKGVKTDALKALLKEIGISEKRIDSVIKVSDIDGIKLDKDGHIEGVDDLKKSLSEEWADFVVHEGVKGANTANPPANTGGSVKSKDEIMKIKDTRERQNALAEYIKNGGN